MIKDAGCWIPFPQPVFFFVFQYGIAQVLRVSDQNGCRRDDY